MSQAFLFTRLYPEWCALIQCDSRNITNKQRKSVERAIDFFSFFPYYFMNPAVLPKIVRIGNVTLQGVSLLFRRSYFTRRTLVLLIQGRTQAAYFQRTAMLRDNIIRKPYHRQFSTEVEVKDSNTFLYVFGVIASLAIAGGIFYYSSGLQVSLQTSSSFVEVAYL